MRLAFWRAGKDKAVIERAVSKPKAEAKSTEAAPKIEAKPAPVAAKQAQAESGDIDLHALGAVLARKRGWIIVPTVLALVASVAVVNLVTPRYKSESRILIDGRENVFLRPSSDRSTEERQSLDPEAVTSQVQLVLSRDLAREIIKKNKLAERPEFDPVLQGVSPLKSLAALVGIGRDPFSMTPEERVLDAYYERLQAYAVDKSRVIVVEFQSADPDLAARVANSIADGYLVLQQNARQDQARNASQWLSGEIENLRKKVSDAEAKVEDFRSKSSPVRRHQQHHAVEPADGRGQYPAQQRALDEGGCGIQGAADQGDAPERQADRGVRGGELRADAAIVGAAGDAAGAARRTIVHAARQSSADQGAEGAAWRPRQPNSRRSGQDLALARKRCADRQRPGRRPDGEPRSAQEAGDLDQRSGRPAPRARARGQGAARPARDVSWEVSRGQHPREHRYRAGGRPHHLARHRLEYAGLSEEAADRADRDDRDAAALVRRRRHRRAAAPDRAARGCCVHAGADADAGAPGAGGRAGRSSRWPNRCSIRLWKTLRRFSPR